MADLPSTKNPTTIFKGMRERLSRRTALTSFSPDSATRALLDGVVSEEASLREDMRSALKANQIGLAQGKDLDAIGGERYKRLSPTYAEVRAVEENLTWYTSTTFGAINGGASFTIPAGTIVSITEAPAGGATVRYELTSDCLCSSGSSTAYCSARALSMGASQNVRARSLNSHDFSSYTDYLSGSLKVTNAYPIENGRDVETDESYRYRLANYHTSLLGAVETKLKLRALEVPGVVNAKVIPGYYGIGTAAVVVFGAEGESTTALVEKVQRQLESSQTGSNKIMAMAGVRVTMDFEINVVVSESPTVADRQAITSGIRRSLHSRLAEADVESIIDLESLRRTIVSDNPRLLSVSSQAAIRDGSIFDNVYVRRSYATSRSTSEREKLTASTYFLEEEEFASVGSVNISFEVRS